jgi:hypothetical protein
MFSYTKSLDVDMFACIEKDITRKFGDVNILICGDCNARIGTNPDYILQDDNTFLPLFQSYPGSIQHTYICLFEIQRTVYLI